VQPINPNSHPVASMILFPSVDPLSLMASQLPLANRPKRLFFPML
jgi:hypothetical protein